MWHPADAEFIIRKRMFWFRSTWNSAECIEPVLWISHLVNADLTDIHRSAEMGTKLINHLKTEIILNCVQKPPNTWKRKPEISYLWTFWKLGQLLAHAQNVCPAVYFTGGWVHSTGLTGERGKEKIPNRESGSVSPTYVQRLYVYGSVHHNIFYEITNRCSYMQSILCVWFRAS
jgi:hypothetical protein